MASAKMASAIGLVDILAEFQPDFKPILAKEMLEAFDKTKAGEFTVKLPKGPVHTKNTIALKIVVFCYRRRIFIIRTNSLSLSQERKASELLSR